MATGEDMFGGSRIRDGRAYRYLSSVGGNRGLCELKDDALALGR